MALARLLRSSLQDDLTTYQAIVSRSKELEKDIPPRCSTSGRRKPSAKKRGSKVARRPRVPPQAALPAPEGREGIPTDRIQSSAVSRPAFMTRPAPVPRRTRDSGAFLRNKARTFEARVCAHNNYDELVRMARGLCSSGDVDCGLALRLLPKQVEAERMRYTVRNDAADRLLERAEGHEAVVSADLDELFRRWSDMPGALGDNMHALPLI